ncbi:helix-turn-helix transcriptional regulator [Myroides odoratimimus]|uniref:helix-turn-helix transcriptional regulator n=1 Tax=Myroides odoratimimus TaxID=76832 RepID=UPI002934AE44|nr:helix-turn-helix domain-containing protein [Myroides odoratimimus]
MFEELEKYTGFKKSYIYHLVHYSKIPYSKPNGKYLFFQKSEINEWLMKNKSLSDDQIQEKAHEYILKKKNI